MLSFNIISGELLVFGRLVLLATRNTYIIKGKTLDKYNQKTQHKANMRNVISSFVVLTSFYGSVSWV